MLSKRIKIRREIISLMRGFYFLPIFLELHKNKILEKLNSNKFVKINSLNFKNKIFLKYIFDYMVRLGIFSEKENRYKITSEGRKMLKRVGTMYILNSYNKITTNFNYNLNNKINSKNLCERKDNIIGSGLIHVKKFFEPSLEMINLKNVKTILDIGCGDGTFLNTVKKSNSQINLLGCDLSKESVKQTKKKLKFQNRSKNIFRVNGANILEIKNKAKLSKYTIDQNSIISLWFLLHEISQNRPSVIIEYLKKMRKNFPKTPLLIGEISKMDNETVKSQKEVSIMPEFMLFHELSSQGLLSENQYLNIFQKSSYNLKKIYRTDNFKFDRFKSSSNFIALIVPN